MIDNQENKDKNDNLTVKNSSLPTNISYGMSIYTNISAIIIYLVTLLIFLYANFLDGAAQQAFGFLLIGIIPILIIAYIYSAIINLSSIILYIVTRNQVKSILRKIMFILNIFNVMITIFIISYIFLYLFLYF